MLLRNTTSVVRSFAQFRQESPKSLRASVAGEALRVQTSGESPSAGLKITTAPDKNRRPLLPELARD
jgi:hypothetical protein